MAAEEVSLSVRLRSLDADAMKRVKAYLEAHHTGIDAFVESTLVKYLKSCEETFEDVMHCPHCYLESGREIPMKGLPILEAEKRGLVKLGSQATREHARQSGTYFVICLECLWWGYPDESALVQMTSATEPPR